MTSTHLPQKQIELGLLASYGFLATLSLLALAIQPYLAIAYLLA